MLVAVLGLVVLGAGGLRAQDTGYDAIAADSVQHAQDSTIAAAWSIIGHDSTQIGEYQKIIAIYKSRKRYAEELQTAIQMVSANPASAAAHFALGDAELDNGAPDSAIAPLKRALIIEPSFVRVRTTIAEAYTMLRMFDSALAQLDTAIVLNPRYAQAHAQRATLLSQTGRDSAAVENYRIAAELLPDSFAPWMKLARVQVKLDRWADALETLQYVRALNDDSPDALFMFAQCREQLGNRTEAADAYESFMLRFPTDRRAMDAERAARELRGQ